MKQVWLLLGLMTSISKLNTPHIPTYWLGMKAGLPEYYDSTCNDGVYHFKMTGIHPLGFGKCALCPKTDSNLLKSNIR